jgi:membrane protein
VSGGRARRVAGGLRDRVQLATWRAVLEFVEDRGHRDAAQIAFFAVASFVPVALLLVGAFGLVFDDDEVRSRVIGTVFESVPLAEEDDRRRLERTVEDALRGAGGLRPIPILLLIAAASGVMSALRHAINQAWDIDERPPLLRRKALDVVLVLGATVILAFSLSLTATRRAAELVDDEAGGGWLAAAALDAVGDALPLLFVTAVLLFLYRVLPMHRQPVREIWPGAIVASVGLLAVKGALELYFEELADLGALYGSLGALMALLIFVYAASIVVVFGAEFASEWARLPPEAEIRRRAREGRGAVMGRARALAAAPARIARSRSSSGRRRRSGR